MNQTTLKIDRDVLEGLRVIAKENNRSPQKQLQEIVSQELNVIRRQEMADRVEASEALEGYAPLNPHDSLVYELRQQWINGDISTEDSIRQLKEKYGMER